MTEPRLPDDINIMAITLKRRTPQSRTEDIVVTWEETLAEEEAERLQLYRDLKSGRLTEEEMMRRNCIDWTGAVLRPLTSEEIMRLHGGGKRKHGQV